MSVETAPTLAFKSVLCGVDGSDADPVTAAQAAIIAGRDARLELVSVAAEKLPEITAAPRLTHKAARRALRHARAVATDYGARPAERIVTAERDDDGLLAAAQGHDLLVVGPPEETRWTGILVGGTATAAAHFLPCPVLIARRAEAFPQRILLADDGHDVSANAVAVAAAIAAQHGADVTLAAPVLMGAPNRERLGRHAAQLFRATGREPVLVHAGEPPSRRLPELARELESTLIVMGSHRKRGLHALSSVSERVAHKAPCSVLVVPA